MTATHDGDVALDSILNFRDVGQYINHLSPTAHLKPGLIYRSARPDSATPSDRNYLTSQAQIRTIIDLRTPTEHLEARKKVSPSISPTPTVPGLAPSDPQPPLRIPGISYADVNLNGKAYTNALLKNLTWTQTAQLYALYAMGCRKSAIAVLAENVMAPRGLSGLAIDTLTHSKAETARIFGILANAEAYPVLVHCTQGKDRTGLIVLLVLLLCGVEREAIERDYMASQTGLAPEREAKVEEVQSIGLPEGFADCEVGWVEKVVEWIEGEGGVGAYLEGCGVARDVLRRVREIAMGGADDADLNSREMWRGDDD